MTLRKKIVLYISLVIAFFSLTAFSFILIVTKYNYRKIERKNGIELFQRLNLLLKDDLSDLENMVVDWAVYDATYEYIKTEDPEFIKENIPSYKILNEININLMMFVNEDGKLIKAFMSDKKDKEVEPVPGYLVNAIMSSTVYNCNIYKGKSHSGLLLFPRGVLMAASYPVSRTNREGGSRGFLVVGKFLDDEELKKYSRIMGVEIFFHELTQADFPDSLKPVLNELTRKNRNKKFVFASDVEMRVFSFLTNEENRKLAMVQIKVPRKIWEDTRLNFYLMIILFFLFVVLLVFYLSKVIDQKILSRLNEMNRIMKNAIKEKKYDVKLAFKENDEIGQLGAEYNQLMETIAENYEEMEITGNIFNNALDELMERHLEFEREFKMAKRIQLNLLPGKDLIDLAPINKTGFYYEAMDQLGGDIYDIIPLSESCYGFYMGDVSGHGVTASLITSQVKVHFQTYFKDRFSIPEVLNKVNKEILKVIGDFEYYFTVFVAVYDRREKILRYTNAGHMPPLFIPHEGSPFFLDGTGFFIGTFINPKWNESNIAIRKGDKLLCYTDGVVELRNCHDQIFGKENLLSSISEIAHFPPDKIVEHITDRLKNFSPIERRQQDDIAIMCLEF